MASTKTNLNDSFWLARYTHNTLQPVLDALPGQDDSTYTYVHVSASSHPIYPGVCVWVHYKIAGSTGILAHETTGATKGDVDRIATELPQAWQTVLDAVAAKA